MRARRLVHCVYPCRCASLSLDGQIYSGIVSHSKPGCVYMRLVLFQRPGLGLFWLGRSLPFCLRYVGCCCIQLRMRC